MRHVHKWKVLITETTESNFEHAIKVLKGRSGNMKVPHQMCCTRRKRIDILTCDGCGKIKRFVTNI